MRGVGRKGREGAGKRRTNRDGCELTRTGPGCGPLFVLVWKLVVVGFRWVESGTNGWWVTSDDPAHHTRIKLRGFRPFRGFRQFISNFYATHLP